VAIGSTSFPAVVDPNWTVDDDNSGGTSGNGNGIVDAGETADLVVPLRNNGGSNAPSVSATLTTTDPNVAVTVPTIFYGPISSGSQVTPGAGFRISTPYTVEDQREVPFLLRVFDGTGNSRTEKLQVLVHATDLQHNSHSVLDLGGNSDGVPDPGETVSYNLKLRNAGTGAAGAVTVIMRNHDGFATVLDSTASFGTIAAGAEVSGDALVFEPTSETAKLELRVSNSYGLLSVKTIDIQRPSAPSDLVGSGQATDIQLQWHKSTESDVRGYNIYRATSGFGPYIKVNPVPTDRTSYYMDEGLTPLTAFFFRITSVDSSANESEPTLFASASTNPPTHAIFPIPLGGTTPSSVAIDHVYSGYPLAIFAGANVLYGWHPDGTSPVDADGAGTTAGDFSTQGKYFAAGPSIADLDGDGTPEIIAPTWTDTSLYVFNRDGTPKAGWPFRARDPIWSSAAIGDLDKDGQMESVFASNGYRFYVIRSNGTEWMDGDLNPATNGVFKVLGSPYNYGSPALADINNDTYLDIVYGSFDGNLYVWDRFGNNLPGFPVNLGSSITASVAVGGLDGPSDTTLEIVVGTSSNLLYVINSNGTVRSPFPWWVSMGGTSKTPSPALADMNNDGYLDIVQAGTNGGMYVFQRTGFMLAPWNNIRYSSYTSGASESSPVVADINGDGNHDVIMGSEDNRLSAFSNNGTMLPGFPIILSGEARGTPAVCDCDGDGMTEIVLAGWDKLLHMWDYDFAFSPGKTPPWPQFHHDARRTGLASNVPFVSVDEKLPDAAPLRVEFALPAPNPARFTTRFEYAIPADRAGESVDLALFDLSGRRVRTLVRGAAQAGRRSVSWNLRDDEGDAARTGIYFARFQLGSEVRSHKFIIVH
ncbi:MAG: FG-GAP-like repeat-containing protein, partial [Candidatus Eisenbacteria bacterium]